MLWVISLFTQSFHIVFLHLASTERTADISRAQWSKLRLQFLYCAQTFSARGQSILPLFSQVRLAPQVRVPFSISTPLFCKNSLIVHPLDQYAPMKNIFCHIDFINAILFKFNGKNCASLQKGNHQSYMKNFVVIGRRCYILGQNLLRIYLQMRANFLLISHKPISAPS